MIEDAIQPSESFVGEYQIVSGRTPDGRNYTGTMTLERRGKFLHAAAALDVLGPRHGLALPFAGRLVMAFGPKDKVEIGAYTLVGDELTGLWVPPGASDEDFTKCGNERSRRSGAPNTFEIQKAHSIDGSAYHGKVVIAPVENPASSARPLTASAPRPVRFTWNLHDGDYHSFGLAYADAIFTTFSFEPDKPHGIAVYEPASGGDLMGTLIDKAALTVWTEVLRRR